MSGMLCNVGGPSIGSYKFSRPNTLAFCLAIRQYLITLFGRYDKRIVIPGKDSTINVYIPIFEWCTNRFNLTPDTLFNGRQYHPRDRICKVTLHALLLHEIAPYASTIKVLINRASVFLSTLQILAILRCETSAFNSSCMRILLSWSLYFSGALFFPLGRPNITPSIFFRAKASFVRWLIRLRSISADSPKAKANTLL